MLNRSYDLWHDLEKEAGQKLLHYTGQVDIGLRESELIRGSLQSCQTYNLEYELLTPSDATKRWPGIVFPEGYVGVFQKDGGILEPEKCNRAHFWLARGNGAKVRFSEIVSDVSTVSSLSNESLIEVTTNTGKYLCRDIVLTPGPWLQELVRNSSIFHNPKAPLPPALLSTVDKLRVERQVVSWYKPQSPHYTPDKFPVFLAFLHHPHHLSGPQPGGKPNDERFYYGFPVFGSDAGFKCARYNHFFEVVNPSAVNRTIDDADVDNTTPLIEAFFPGILSAEAKKNEVKAGTSAAPFSAPSPSEAKVAREKPSNYMRSGVCMFTNTPDGHFVLDAFPAVSSSSSSSSRAPTVTVISACAGHGFKFSSAIGECAADLALGVERRDLEWLKSDRFLPKEGEAKAKL